MERELINCIDQVTELFKCDYSLSVQDLGLISSIVDTGPKERRRLRLFK